MHKNKDLARCRSVKVKLHRGLDWISLMRYHKLPSHKLHPSSNSNYQVLIPCPTMPRNTSTKILNDFHPTNNEKVRKSTASSSSKFFRIISWKNYTLGAILTVDESMIKFKGCSSMKQYVPVKPLKHSFKVGTLADAQSDDVCRFHVYPSKESSRKSSLDEHVVKNAFSNRVSLQENWLR